jgi:hypothetical protein
MNIYYILFILCLIITLLVLILWKKNTKDNKDTKNSKDTTCKYPVDSLCCNYKVIDPENCQQIKLNKEQKCGVNDDNCPQEFSNHCALELIVGDKMHMTMAYICNCPISNKKNNNETKKAYLNELVNALKSHNYWGKNSKIKIELKDMMGGFFGENSMCVVGDLAKLKDFIMNEWFSNKDSCITIGTWGSTPHTQVLFGNGVCGKKYDTVDILDINNWRLE